MNRIQLFLHKISSKLLVGKNVTSQQEGVGYHSSVTICDTGKGGVKKKLNLHDVINNG